MNSELIERIDAELERFFAESESMFGSGLEPNMHYAGIISLLRDCKSRIERLTSSAEMMNNCIHDLVVGNQAAWIEWQHGKGAEAAIGWIHNSLWGPGHIPDEDEPYGKEPQAYFDANRSNPFPQCPCGRPSNIMWMGKGFCCEEHYQEKKMAEEGSNE